MSQATEVAGKPYAAELAAAKKAVALAARLCQVIWSHPRSPSLFAACSFRHPLPFGSLFVGTFARACHTKFMCSDFRGYMRFV